MSSDDKKDLTRIEDLSEYIHELNGEDDSLVPEQSEGDAETPLFESEDDADLFATSTEENTDFSSAEFESTDFGIGEEEFQAQDLEEEDIFSNSTEEEVNFDSPILDEMEVDAETETNPEIESETEIETEAQAPTSPDLSFIDLEPDLEKELDTQTATLLDNLAPTTQEYLPQENFDDIKKFAENTSFTGKGAEGNPSFSVLIRNVRYVEDVTDILALLKELGLESDSEEKMRSRLMRGSFLVPRISEFAAIFLAHKLRRFSIDIQLGPSDEIHPPRHNEEPEIGLVSKFNLYQNQTHHFEFDDPKLEISQIIVSATPTLEGYQVIRYLGVGSEHIILEGHLVEDEDSTDIPQHYHELAQKLKAHALKAHANAVIGLNYQLTPLPSEYGAIGSKYRLTCTGNLVWVTKI